VKIVDFKYDLPSELIAQHPSQRRQDSRLMVVDRRSKTVEHRRFADLSGFVSAADLLVLNNTKVFPARLYASREGGKKKLEVLLLNKVQDRVWEVLVRPGRKVRPGTRLIFQPDEFEGEILESSSPAVRKLRLEYTGNFWTWIKRLGQIPLPPYISRPPIQEDYKRYQTIFARVPGSVAAPTAGLHFTTDLLGQLPHCEITLHIGYGTFKPIKTATIQGHQMDKEYYKIGQEAASLIQSRSRSSGKLIAVGTSTTRALEQVFVKHQRVISDSGWANLFIYPGFDFRVLGGLITNFHLPGSTLLFLVSAFAGKDLIQRCYREAVQRKYRFYSYGDAMLIL